MPNSKTNPTPATFVAAGSTWSVRFNVGDAMAIRREYGVNLFALLEIGSGEFDRLAADPATLVAILWDLVADQAATRGIDAAEFGKSFTDGDQVAAAAEALVRATLNFYPAPRRAVAEAIWNRTKQETEQATAAAIEIVNRTEPRPSGK